MKIIASNVSSLYMNSKVIKIIFIRLKSRLSVCLKIAAKIMQQMTVCRNVLNIIINKMNIFSINSNPLQDFRSLYEINCDFE